MVIFIASCQPIVLEKGSPLAESSRTFIVRELDRKTLNDGKRIQIVGYFDDRWAQKGRKVSLFLEQERNNMETGIQRIELDEGTNANNIFLGKTGASEAIANGPMMRDEYIAEDMRIYDNNGIPHKMTEKFGVSATIEYRKDFWGNVKSYQDANGNINYQWELKNFRADAEEK